MVKGLDLLLREQGLDTLGLLNLQRLRDLQNPKWQRDGQALLPAVRSSAGSLGKAEVAPDAELGSTVELLPRDTGYTKANTGSRTCSWWRDLLWVTTCTKSPVPAVVPAGWEHQGSTLDTLMQRSPAKVI